MSQPASPESTAIIWTREAGDWEADRRFFADTSIPLLPVPCLRFTAMAMGDRFILEQQTLADARILLTSARAVEFLSDAAKARLKEATRIDCLTEKSRQKLAAHGLVDNVFSAEAADGAAFAAFLSAEADERQRFLWLRGSEVAFDLSATLKRKALLVREVFTYQTLPGAVDLAGNLYDGWQELAAQLPAECKRWIVGLSSPMAVRSFERLWLDGGWSGEGDQERPQLIAVAIGQTTADACRQQLWSRVEVLAAPAVEALAKRCLGLADGASSAAF